MCSPAGGEDPGGAEPTEALAGRCCRLETSPKSGDAGPSADGSAKTWYVLGPGAVLMLRPGNSEMTTACWCSSTFRTLGANTKPSSVNGEALRAGY